MTRARAHSPVVHGRPGAQLTSPDGDVYEGGWLAGKYHGKGKFSRANGHYYDGQLLHGKADGLGSMVR